MRARFVRHHIGPRLTPTPRAGGTPTAGLAGAAAVTCEDETGMLLLRQETQDRAARFHVLQLGLPRAQSESPRAAAGEEVQE